MQLRLIHLIGAVALSACATGAVGGGDPVAQLLGRSQALNGQEVQARGIFRAREGFANLYSRDGRQCVGLLTHTVSAGEMPSLEGRTVRATGRLMAEGCPKGGSCSEHLCGPAVLYNARVEPQP